MFQQISEVFSPLSRSFKRVNLEPFEDLEKTKDCIMNPLSEGEKKDLDEQCIGDIHHISGGSPYEINLIAHHMYKRYKEEDGILALSPQVLEDVAEELDRIRESGHYAIADEIKQLLSNQLQMVLTSLEFPTVPEDWLVKFSFLNDVETLEPESLASSRSSRRATINYLIDRGVLKENEEERISFAGDQFDTIYLNLTLSN